MDSQTLESIAEMICGDGENFPVYRSGSELTRFFQRVGFSNFIHDGSTRKWWALNVLQQLSENNLKAVLLRLANPREYRGNQKEIKSAISELNKILMIEGIKIILKGVNPSIISINPQFEEQEIEKEKEKELKPLPPPDFLNLKIDQGLGTILSKHWEEIQKSIDATAYLGATILMGSLLEGILLAVLSKEPQTANSSKIAPKNKQNGKVKNFPDWSLAEMINVAHDLGWLDLDVKKFSHALRDFRNLIHPYQQMALNTFPDKDTIEISWLVVQAATNDLAQKLS